jgi:hypothetical protein
LGCQQKIWNLPTTLVPELANIYNSNMVDELVYDFSASDTDPSKFNALVTEEAKRNFVNPELPLQERLGAMVDAMNLLATDRVTGNAVLGNVNRYLNADVLRDQGTLTSAFVTANRAWDITVDMLTNGATSERNARLQRTYNMLKEPTYGIPRQQVKDMYNAAHVLVQARRTVGNTNNGNPEAVNAAMKIDIEKYAEEGTNKGLLEAMVKRAIDEYAPSGNQTPPDIKIY